MFKFFKGKIFLPKTCRLEACSLCQLNCKDCYMRKNNSGKIGKGYLTAKNFEKFLDLNSYLKQIELSNNGEIFLNPELIDIMKIAYDRKIIITASNGVNFNNVKDEVLEALVKYNFRMVTISIDGASNETYSKYRVNGNFDKVIENIKKLIEIKNKYNNWQPYILWQYIVLPTDCDIEEIRKAKQIAAELGIDITFKKDWGNFLPPNLKEVEKETNLSYEKETLRSIDKSRWIPCADTFFNPQINWDGRFLGCCCLFDDIYDLNAFDLSLEEILKSKQIAEVKNLIKGKYWGKEKAKTIKCYNCWFYSKICRDNEFIKEKELSPQNASSSYK